MGLKDIILTILYAFIMTSAIIYCWYRLSNEKIEFRSRKLYIYLSVIALISALNFLVVNKYFRIILITTLLMVAYKLLYNVTIHKCVLTPIYSQILIFFAELIYLVVVLGVMHGFDEKTMNTIFAQFITNVSVSVLLVIMVQFKFVHKVYNLLLKLTDRIRTRQLVVFCLIGMLILNILIMGSYYKIKFEYFILINASLILFVLILIVYMLKAQNNYNKVSDQYNIAKNSLIDYENMMTKYRVANHENKNLLLTVRAMAVNEEKNIPEYIDSIIEDKYEDDERLLFEMGVIPTGGLRAAIYSEILKIKENKINYDLNIDRKISTIDLIELDTNTIIDICKILGVFIDNSIEAVRGLKQKHINIDMYIIENSLCIKVSNNFSGKIDISKISDEGYTTKGKGHGYGLPLVKKIINSNNNLKNETELSKKIFSQVLIIRYKKNH